MSAPLSPIEIRELPAHVRFETATPTFQLGPARIETAFVNHRGPTLGYRISDAGQRLCYIPDHEPALAQALDQSEPDWISGYQLARDADLLIHDCQYFDSEYPTYLGFGHCAVGDALRFAHRSCARQVMLFHHDPSRTDIEVDRLLARFAQAKVPVEAAIEETVLTP